MNRFADIANQAKIQHQQATDEKAAKEAEAKRQYEEGRSAERHIIASEILPIFEEARVGLIQAGLPASIQQDPESFNHPKATLRIARQVDRDKRAFEISSEVSATVDLESKRIRLSRMAWMGGPGKAAYAPIGQAESKISSEIEIVIQEWLRINETLKDR